MKYDELHWKFVDDDFEPHHVSQRLRPICIDGSPLEHLPRVYVKKWRGDGGSFTVIRVYPPLNGIKMEFHLDLADVAVRLIRLMEDERVPLNLTSLEPM